MIVFRILCIRFRGLVFIINRCCLDHVADGSRQGLRIHVTSTPCVDWSQRGKKLGVQGPLCALFGSRVLFVLLSLKMIRWILFFTSARQIIQITC